MGTRTDPVTRAWRWFNAGILGLVVVAGLWILWLVSFGNSGPPFAAPPCFPPAYHLKATSVPAGAVVVVEAPDAACDPRYGSGAQVEVRLLDARQRELARVLAPMNDGGGFSASLTVPASLPAGDYGISAMPYGVDWCDDTGRNNRVSHLALDLKARSGIQASCALRSVPLTVTAP